MLAAPLAREHNSAQQSRDTLPCAHGLAATAAPGRRCCSAGGAGCAVLCTAWLYDSLLPLPHLEDKGGAACTSRAEQGGEAECVSHSRWVRQLFLNVMKG